MKITLSHYNTTHTVETPNNDLTSSEAIELFLGILKAAGWNESTIQDTIINIAEEYKDENF